MLIKFRRYISENSMLKSGDNVLLAVSGGIDSMVMAHLFRSVGIRSGIAHCNFSLRGMESDLDEEFVRNYADKHQMPFHSVKFNTMDFAEDKGISVQMAARELRYAWFEQLRLKYGYDWIAVAHNLNDNIETFLINLTRGTGLSGLTGIQAVSNKIIRPLLFATRSEIELYCKKHKILYREDRSNKDVKYTRNKIRHLVVPVLKEINPSIEYTLGETIERLKEAKKVVEKYISELRQSISTCRGDSIIFNNEKLKNLVHDTTALFELFRPFGISGPQAHDLSDVIRGKTGGQIFTVSHRILKNRNEIVVCPNTEMNIKGFRIDSVEDFMNVPWIESAHMVDITDNHVIPTDKNTACLDAEALIFPLYIRKWNKGDYFYPLGMKNKKKLSDFFIDRKLSILGKEKVFVLESGGKIAWVIGHRIDSRFSIRSSISKALEIRVSD